MTRKEKKDQIEWVLTHWTLSQKDFAYYCGVRDGLDFNEEGVF